LTLYFALGVYLSGIIKSVDEIYGKDQDQVVTCYLQHLHKPTFLLLKRFITALTKGVQVSVTYLHSHYFNS